MVTVLFLVMCVALAIVRPRLVAVSFVFLFSECIKAVISVSIPYV
jgi:hypothetical protein